MPIVLLQAKRDRGLEEITERLALELPRIVSGALDVPDRSDARLTPDDIEIRVSESGKLDVNAKDLEIIVFAHDYPERTQYIEARKDRIIAEVHRFLADYDRNVSGWVWILPQQLSAFGQI